MEEIRNHRFLKQNFTGEKWKVRLINCEFVFCKFSSSDFSESEFISVSGHGNSVEHLSYFPEGYRIGKDGILYGPDSLDLSAATLNDLQVLAKNWSNSKLSKINVRKSKFTDCDFSGADFSDSDLVDVVFESCDFTGCAFDNAKLENVNFQGCIVENTKFGTSKFQNVRFNWAQGDVANLARNFQILAGVLFGPAANISNSHISKVDLREIDLTGIVSGGVIGNPLLPQDWKLVNGYLVGPGANLCEADLTNVILEDVNLDAADLSNALLSGISSANLRGTPSSLPKEYQLIGGYILGPNVVIRDRDLSFLDLSSCNLYGVKSKNVIGTKTKLPQGWALVNGYLVGENAKVGGADLSNQTIENVNISGIDFSSCNFKGIRGHALLGEPTKLPLGWRLSGGVFLGPTANISGVNLSKSDLSFLPLAGPSKITGEPSALPAEWRLVSGYLVGPSADLRNADLSGSNMEGVNIDGAILTDAILREVSSGQISGIPAELPTGWSLVGGYLVGPGADLRNADLSNCNLAGCNLNGANLMGAKLEGCTIGPNVGKPSQLPDSFHFLENGFIGPNLILSGIVITADDLIALRSS